MNKDEKQLSISQYAELTKVNVRVPTVVNLELNKLAELKDCSVSTVINEAFSQFLKQENINIYNDIKEQFKFKFNNYISNSENQEFLFFYINKIEKNLQDVNSMKFVDVIWSLVERLYDNESVVSKRRILNLLCYQKEYTKDIIIELFKQEFVKDKLAEGRTELLENLNITNE